MHGVITFNVAHMLRTMRPRAGVDPRQIKRSKEIWWRLSCFALLGYDCRR
jgi:hypothetical protein